MPLLDLPNEVLLQIVECFVDHSFDSSRSWGSLSIQSHYAEVYISRMTRVNRRFRSLFNDYLYRHNVQRLHSSGLLWAAKHKQLSTARRLLDAGANVDARLNYYAKNNPYYTPLIIAVRKKDHEFIKLLLDRGANPEVSDDYGLTPFSHAIKRRLDNIALLILEHISDLATCNVGQSRHFRPALHVASGYGLPKSVRYILERGVEVDGLDGFDKTPLYDALNSPLYLTKMPFNGSSLDDDLLECMEILMECGADPDIKIITSDGWVGELTPRELAARHKDERVRLLFEVSLAHLDFIWMEYLSI
ncbi:hypothetical protein G7Y89_g10426 [Cudoniella acicularis]|uniref:Uncharacterized protein n=1 Tax=Cudoniella acicularis TaxID=354080 RepID=A0A8H4VYS3_9HELO|nr:hypothetical protein G7Y89_g10426 [Cudoniella acicularis]